VEIVQKKRSHKHTFVFGDSSFNFAYDDKSGSGDFDINYANVPDKSSISIEQNEWLKNVGYLWCAIGAFQIGYAIFTESSLSGKGFWIVVGLACLAWAYFSKVKYSVFNTEQGNIFITHGARHDEIIREIESRRKLQRLEWYGEINMDNDLKIEIQKFNWLKEKGVISEEEAEQKIAQVEMAHKDNFDLPGERIN